MKLKLLSMNSALMLTSMLFAPSMAVAQQTDPVAQEEATTTEEVTEGTDEGEVVVLGRFIPEPQKQTSEVAAFLTSEDLARTGDDTAAAALTRVTGLSVVGERFVFVRGLGDRYSSALLNGSPLPSPEPLRRQVPLDLFPSNILNGAAVQKTFSANYPGEFGGGIIDLNTLKLPNETFFSVKVGSALNSESTLEKGLTYYGEGSDWTTFSDNARDIPDELQSAIARGRPINRDNFSAAELEGLGESLTNSPVNVVQSEKLDPDFEGEVTAGTSIDVGKYNIGLLGVFGYDSTMRTQNAQRQQERPDGQLRRSTWDVVGNLFGSASLGWDTHSLALTGLLVRTTTKEAQTFEGADPDALTGVRYYDEGTAWFERQLASFQLAGEHEFGALKLDWRTAFAQSTRDAPYEREISYERVNTGPYSYRFGTGGGNSLNFTELTDEVLSGGLDGSYDIALTEQRDMTISAGFATSNTVRDYTRYSFEFAGAENFPNGTTTFLARPDYLFSPDNIGPGGFFLNETTLRDGSYKGRLTVNAAYAQVEADVLPLVRATVGVRYEDASQVVRTSNRFGLSPFAPEANLQNEYFLPAVTLTWNFAEDLQARVGYSQTIARPQFRELAKSVYRDTESGRDIEGNPFLTDTEFKNYDARVEYYFGRNRFATLGVFYKEVDKPIEEYLDAAGGLTTKYINAPSATLQGVEAEFRTRFSLPFETPILTGAEWLFAVNYTYTKSEVSTNGTVTTVSDATTPFTARVQDASVVLQDGSPLVGTPENIANIQFGYETDASQLTLLVGWVDERILVRGLGSGVPPVIDVPGTQVDLVYRRDVDLFGTKFTLGLSGRNLLDEQHQEYRNDPIRGRYEVNTYDRGATYSASLSVKY